MITLDRAKEIIGKFSSQKILVVGDLMLDRYVSGTVDRISPEAPVPVVHVREEHCQPGGASNVALNVQSLGGHSVVAGIVGKDVHAELLMGLLKEDGISNDGIVASDSARTIVKTRIVADRQQIVRVDYEDAPEDIYSATKELAEKMPEFLSGVTGVVIEDYGKGVIDSDLVKAVLAAAKEAKIPVGFDPKDNHDLAVSGIALATPNFKEACMAAGLPAGPLIGDSESDKRVEAAAKILLDKWKTDLLIITLGSHGMYLASRDGKPCVIPTRAREVFDVSGAGDTVIATAILALVSGADLYEAASLANYAAGVVVGKVGTAICSNEELLKGLKSED